MRRWWPLFMTLSACYLPAGGGYYGAPPAPPGEATAPPPRQDHGYRERPRWAPRECRSAYGTTACGFHCEAAYGEVRCARTPMGACASAYGRVVCWDPDPAVAQAYGYRGRPAECLAGYGDVACGYGCVAAYGQVRCAGTPEDLCQSSYGEIHCTDR